MIGRIGTEAALPWQMTGRMQRIGRGDAAAQVARSREYLRNTAIRSMKEISQPPAP